MEIAGIAITHPDKIIFPEAKISKGQMIAYYERIAGHMLSHLRDRPLTLERYPDGLGGYGFIQKNAADYYPDFIRTLQVETDKGRQKQILCQDKRSLVYLANQGTISFHTWLSRRDKLHQPDQVVYDLDPPGNDLAMLKEAVKVVRKSLQDADYQPELMSSGKSGFHLICRIRRGKSFDELREEARELAEEMAERHPKLLTTEISKNQRKGRIFVDYLRNAYGQTTICPYSLRATARAGLATPLDWQELGKLQRPDAYGPENIFRRLSQKG
jgi:bifunctional non-homologous end joining protein LigD